MSRNRRGLSRSPRVAMASAERGVSAPGTVYRAKPVGNPKSFNVGNKVSNLGLPTQIVYILDNSTGSTPKDYMLFDSIGMIASLAGGTFNEPQTPILTNTIINKFIETHPLSLKGIKIVVTASEAQFSNKLMAHVGEVDGQLAGNPIVLDTALSADQYNPKIQDYAIDLVIDNTRGISYTVDANEKVVITFYIAADFNKM
jgi:hypothetical protein